jgi:pyruvate,orthophosphate dikinase
MSAISHWPHHFYLIATGDTSRCHKPDRERMGSKAFNLLRMAAIDLPVPPALVIGTHFTQSPEQCLHALFKVGLAALQDVAGQIFGDARNPLIVSVRSGAPVSMPGMMETLLNIGLCDRTLPGLLRQSGNPRLIWDAYRRLVATYGEVVEGLPAALFENELENATRGRDERELDFSELRALTRRFLAIYQESARKPFPQDVNEQLSSAICAVFASWESEKAQTYRKLNGIDAAMGTAVTIQRMVFGNSGGQSGAGVGFTRDPTNGERRLWVDFLSNAQGEDVVSGRRNAYGNQTLADNMPEAWGRLEAAAKALEGEFADMQDFEFTVQDGTLYMLQTRSGKRTPLACARIALDLLDEGIIDTAAALERTSALQEADIGTVQLAPQGSRDAQPRVLAKAMPACSGVVWGEIALDKQRALQRSQAGVPIILVRQDAETSDIEAVQAAVGLLTQRGARTSHAAVVARQLGKVCLVGCGDLGIDMTARTVSFGATILNEGDIITLDGNEQSIYAGEMAAALVPDLALLERLRALRGSHGEVHHPKHRK